MKPLCQFFRKPVAVTSAFLASFICGAQSAYAASLGTMFGAAATDGLGIARAIEMGAYLGGLSFVVIGLLKLAQLSNQPGQPKGPAAMHIIIGALLLGVGVFTSAVSGTFGDAGASTGLGKLGIGG